MLVDSDFLETLLDVLREHFGGCFSRLMARVCTAWQDAVSRRRALWEYAGLWLDPRTSRLAAICAHARVSRGSRLSNCRISVSRA